MEQKTQLAKQPFFKSVRNYFREYCNYSSIHGFRYFGEKRTYFERGWWFVVFSLTLAGLGIAIREVYQKWVNSPVIVSFATKETPIYSIPFPSVTICPQSKSIQKIYNHTLMIRKRLENTPLTEREQKLLDYMALICEKNDILDYSDTLVFTEDFFEQLVKINDIYSLIGCEYMGEKIECDDIFKPIITDEGICFSFNMLDRSEIFNDHVTFYKDFNVMGNLTYKNWSMDKGYSEEAGIYPYPRRALLAGAKNSLSVMLLTSKANIDSTCKESLHGFKVILHTPMRIPRPSQQYFRVPLNQVLLGAIQPVMITTSESVQLYNPKRRECFFPDERKLKYFKIYTSLNCQLECLTNYTLYHCGCVKYFMPRNVQTWGEEGAYAPPLDQAELLNLRDNITDLCGVGSLKCMEDAEKDLQMGNLRDKIGEPKNRHNKTRDLFGDELPNCNCMPICTDLSYDVEISQSDWNWLDLERAISKDGKLSFEEDQFHLSRLTLFFKSTRFITSQRHELYGPTDFLANFGGLLGLFTGFSVLSLMEAIYFLTVRLCCNSRLYGYWAGPETS